MENYLNIYGIVKKHELKLPKSLYFFMYLFDF